MSIKRNAAYNMAGLGLPLALSLFTIPIYLEIIGEARYGVLAIAWLLLGYFGLFDLGLGEATAQRIASLRAAPARDRARTFWTALAMNSALGILGALILWPLAGFFFENVFRIDPELRTEVSRVAPLLAAAVPIATATGVLTGALQGREQFLSLNIISASSTAIFQIAPLLVAWLHGPELIWLVLTAVAARCLTVAALLLESWRHIAQSQPIRISKSEIASLAKFGSWVSLTALVSSLMIIFDRLAIGAISGAAAVTHYTIPFNIAQRLVIFPMALLTALFPRFSAATRAEDELLAREAARALLAVTTPVALIGILLFGPFLDLWLGENSRAEAAHIGSIALFAFWLSGLARIPYVRLTANGRPDLVSKTRMLQVLPYVALVLVALQTYGPVGAAWVYALRCACDFLILNRLAPKVAMPWRTILHHSGLLAGAGLVSIALSPFSVLWVAAAAGLSLVAGGSASRMLTPSAKQMIFGRTTAFLGAHHRRKLSADPAKTPP